MLRISIEQNEESLAIKLDGRIAGPWAAELARTWEELAPKVGPRKLVVDLRNTTYADGSGIELLREIHSRTAAEFLSSGPWTKYLTEEITRGSATQTEE